MQYLRRDINTLQKQIDGLGEDIRSTRTLPPPEPAGSVETRKEQADISAELENVKRHLSNLRAIIEDNQHLTSQTSRRLDDQERPLTARFDHLEAKLDQLVPKGEGTPSQPVLPEGEIEAALSPELKKPAAPETPPSRVSSDVERAYQKAYEAFRADDLDEAKNKFLVGLKEYPDTPLSDNAQGWIG